MHRPLVALVLILAASSAIEPLRAQSPVPVSVGQRVRVATPSQHGQYQLVGNVVATRSDTLLLQTPDVATPRAIALGDISTLEVSRGVHGNGRRGMLWGSVVGATLGGIVGAVTYKKPDCAGATFFCGGVTPNRSADVVAGAIVGAVAGLAVGGIWGANHPTERWVQRSLGSTHVGLAPGTRGATVTLSRRF